jgi:hypothetical protein
MQDISPQDQNPSLSQLKAENAKLKAENAELRAANKTLTERNEHLSRLILDLQERSELGRKARDTFASLKKTCKKLGVCFWDYLRDRVGMYGQIQPLSHLIVARARGSPI